ncbi:MAG: nucleoside recognition domain-containing protein [Verrucomicrobiota bacterium]
MNSEFTAKKFPRRSETKRPSVAVLGLESVGKSSLLSALSGRFADSSALIGSTLHCQHYPDESWDWVDTPGLVTGSDAATVRDALDALESAESVLVVLRAYRAREELAAILPTLGSRKVAVILTFRDSLASLDQEKEQHLLASWKEKLGVPVMLLDSRSPDATELSHLRIAVKQSSRLQPIRPDKLPTFPKAQRKSWKVGLERAMRFVPLSLIMLFGPACFAVIQANALADRFYDSVGKLLAPLLSWLNELPAPLAAILGGDYGIVAMFPFLVLYALPTILIFTVLIGIYKSTGLIDHLSYSLHKWLKPFGLGGRDLVRVVMGFGCNVPAVAATRSCPTCSRGTCVSAISFGSACSYQLPSTLAVFAAAGFMWLGPVYLAILALTTLLYLRLTKPSALLQAQSKILLPTLSHLRSPDWRAVFREAIQSLRDFALMALPIFVGICIIAGLLQWSGVLHGFTHLLAPVMAVFNLPPEAALAIVLGSVRKDGIAIGLLNAERNLLKVPLDTPIQVLTAVYLAGVLLPCLVTLLAVAKEMRPSFALKMVGRQVCYAALFSLCIAWFGALLILSPLNPLH